MKSLSYAKAEMAAELHKRFDIDLPTAARVANALAHMYVTGARHGFTAGLGVGVVSLVVLALAGCGPSIEKDDAPPPPDYVQLADKLNGRAEPSSPLDLHVCAYPQPARAYGYWFADESGVWWSVACYGAVDYEACTAASCAEHGGDND